ncbi:hypothetical protein [Maridesulfovibrio bastinii]|uniref:hypothetical protein n=1 Tax=Maridesulfovibrio bastinii TaxID=47157 RepID=UPI00041C1504|nr:hypothetical protein [Maridesulfovibrio bastinii]
MRKTEIIKKQKEELDRFRDIFAIAMKGDDIDAVKELKLKLEIMNKRHEMERKTWGICDSPKSGREKSAGMTVKAPSNEIREKLNEIYRSC